MTKSIEVKITKVDESKGQGGNATAGSKGEFYIDPIDYGISMNLKADLESVGIILYTGRAET